MFLFIGWSHCCTRGNRQQHIAGNEWTLPVIAETTSGVCGSSQQSNYFAGATDDDAEYVVPTYFMWPPAILVFNLFGGATSYVDNESINRD